MIKGTFNEDRLARWKYSSSDELGLHEIISPKFSDCEVANIFRLNLKKGDEFKMDTKDKEMSFVSIKGKSNVQFEDFSKICEKFDSFYVTKNNIVNIKVIEDVIFYIATCIDEGYGRSFFRKFDITMPIGNIHQIHGEGTYEREVFMTLDPDTPSSRILSGITWSREGGWSSWPPHQHEKDLEEVYCYFDMDSPKFGLHLSYINSGDEQIVCHKVSSGDMVLAPRGYHPTVSTPNNKNTYVWFLFAHSHESRRYDLAVLDPKRS